MVTSITGKITAIDQGQAWSQAQTKISVQPTGKTESTTVYYPGDGKPDPDLAKAIAALKVGDTVVFSVKSVNGSCVATGVKVCPPAK